MRVVGLIPARGGSKGIPNKNIIDLCGRPLIVHTIEAALKSRSLSRVVVSTDSSEIASIALKSGAEVPFMRPPQLANDTAPAIDVIEHFLDQFAEGNAEVPDAIVYLQPTSPFRNEDDIDASISIMKDKSADTVVSILSVPHNFLAESQMTISEDGELSFDRTSMTLRRQEKSTRIVARNGPAILLVKTSTIREGRLYGDRTYGYQMSQLRSLDIDSPIDLEICRRIFPLVMGHK